MKDLTKAEIKEIVRKNLVKFRKEKGVTQSDVGAYLGIGKTGVASWEQGRTSPDIETVYLLSKYYRKSIDSFYEEEEKTHEPILVSDLTEVSVLSDLPYKKHHKVRSVPVELTLVNKDGQSYVVTLDGHLKEQDKKLTDIVHTARLHEVIKTPDVERGVVNEKKNQSS